MLPKLSGFLEAANAVVRPQRGACILGSLAIGCCILVVVVAVAMVGYFYNQTRQLHSHPASASQAQGRLAEVFPGFRAPAGYEIQAGTQGLIEGVLWRHLSEHSAVILLLYTSPSRDSAFDPQQKVEESFLRGQAGFPGDAKIIEPIQVKLGDSLRSLEQIQYPAGKALRVQGSTATQQFQWLFLGTSGQQTRRFTASLPWNELTVSESASPEQLQLIAQATILPQPGPQVLALNPETRFSADGVCLGSSLDQVRSLRNIPETVQPVALLTTSPSGLSLFGYGLEHQTTLFVFDPAYKLEAVIGVKRVFLGQKPYITLGDRHNIRDWVADSDTGGHTDRQGDRLSMVHDSGVLPVKGLTLSRFPARGLHQGCQPAPAASQQTGQILTQLPWQ